MSNLRYVCVQPRNLYFAWQVEVMINNFLKNGISGNDIDILVAYDNSSSLEDIEAWSKLANKYNYVRFFFYEDTRESKSYIPSVYFNILKQHLKNHPELTTTPLFLHDCDIIFTKPVDFNCMLNDNIWYMSDTVSYIGSNYILSKGRDVYEDMCKIMEIDPFVPKIMNSNSGGAQYIVKGVTYEFFDKVEKDSIKLYKHFCDTEHLHTERGRESYPIQKWTAGMWSLLWNAWKFGNETKVDKRLDFCWATDPIHKWEQNPIYHNSGVVDGSHGNFFKGGYIKSLPYNIKLEDANQTRASYNYVKEIVETAKTSCLI